MSKQVSRRAAVPPPPEKPDPNKTIGVIVGELVAAGIEAMAGRKQAYRKRLKFADALLASLLAE